MSKPNSPADTSADTSGSPGGMSKAKIGAIIAVLMAVECVAMVLFLPRSAESSPAPTAEAGHAAEGDEHAAHEETAKDEHEADAHEVKTAAAEAEPAKGHGKKADKHASTPVKSGNASEEIDLGEFSVTSYQPASNTTLFISFHLFGTLLHKNNDELQRRLEDNKHRIRDNIIVIIRSAEITDLTDAGLGLIKRRILETTNKTLGKPLLQAVVFSDFSFVEQ